MSVEEHNLAKLAAHTGKQQSSSQPARFLRKSSA